MLGLAKNFLTELTYIFNIYTLYALCTHEGVLVEFFWILRDLTQIPSSLELDVFVIMVYLCDDR